MFIKPTKFDQLLEAIKSKRFPILLSGPSGTGKSHSIKLILDQLKLKYKFVDISTDTINRSLIRGIILITQLNDPKNLANIKYFDNLIIETSLMNLKAVELERFHHISFNKITQKRAQKLGIKDFNGNLFSLGLKIKQEDASLNFYNFIGKIFYNKLNIQHLQCKDGYVTYGIGIGDRSLDSKKLEHYGMRNMSGRSLDSKKLEDGNQKEEMHKLDISPSNDSSDIITARRNKKDIPFSDSFDDFGSNEENLRLSSGSEIDKFIFAGGFNESREIPLEPFEICVSFNKTKVESYLYENFLNFIELEDLTEVYEMLCELDVKDNSLPLDSFICALATKCRGKGKFVSFKSGYYHV